MGSHNILKGDKAMADVNVCVLGGNLVHSPAKGTTDRGPTCKFSFGNNVGYGDNQKTQYINVSVWGKLGENCLEYLVHKQHVTVTGEVFLRRYEKKDGSLGASLDLSARDVFFGAKPKAGEQKQETSPPPPPSDDDIPF